MSTTAGIYVFGLPQIASGVLADFTFTVKPEGTMDFDESCDGFLNERGTSKHTILGLEVTLNALRLTGGDTVRITHFEVPTSWSLSANHVALDHVKLFMGGEIDRTLRLSWITP